MKFAESVAAAGGTSYYVGGFVRDRIMGVPNKDIDIEVHGITPEKLYEILEKIGEPVTFGKSFGVYSLRGVDVDIAMPRREKSTASGGPRGHRDFEIETDPFIGTLAAARRRDFTINALMENVITGEITDHFGGLKDLEDGVIRHIDPETFVEDPLRVLRAAQFAARFGFRVSDETVLLCRDIDLSALSRERVEGEMKKALLKADKPSVFFEVLREMLQLGVWFPELEDLIGVEQDPVYHPEGDVWVHTMEVIDRAAQYRDKTSDPYAFMLLALTHDFGKKAATEFLKGRIHAYGHEIKGLPLVERFLERLTGDKAVKAYVLNMVPLHMRPNIAAYSKPAVKSTNRMFDEASSPEDLIWMSMADRPLFAGSEAYSGDSGFLFDRLRIYEETMAKPYVRGRDLEEAGLKPGKYYSEVLEYAHKLRLAGIPKDLAMKQVLSYARKCTKKQKSGRGHK